MNGSAASSFFAPFVSAMTSLRSISTLLVLGMLLLPPHWCCAFEPAGATDDSAAELRPCCVEREKQATPAAKVTERKASCCAGRDAQRGDAARRKPSASREGLSGGAPVDTTLCPYCLPRIAPKGEVATFVLELPLVSVVGVQLPTLCEGNGAAACAVGTFIPISSDLLARHCRWNC